MEMQKSRAIPYRIIFPEVNTRIIRVLRCACVCSLYVLRTSKTFKIRLLSSNSKIESREIDLVILVLLCARCGREYNGKTVVLSAERIFCMISDDMFLTTYYLPETRYYSFRSRSVVFSWTTVWSLDRLRSNISPERPGQHPSTHVLLLKSNFEYRILCSPPS